MMLDQCFLPPDGRYLSRLQMFILCLVVSFLCGVTRHGLCNVMKYSWFSLLPLRCLVIGSCWVERIGIVVMRCMLIKLRNG